MNKLWPAEDFSETEAALALAKLGFQIVDKKRKRVTVAQLERALKREQTKPKRRTK